MDTNTPDRVSQIVWLMLAIAGAVLCVIAWYEFLR
jgi:tryptophan-rich sensory protein